MMAFYSYISPMIIVFFLSSFTSKLISFSKTKLTLVCLIFCIVSTYFSVGQVNLLMLVNAWVGPISISTAIILWLLSLKNFNINLTPRPQLYHLLYALTPLVIFYYLFSTTAFTSFYPYSYGYQPRLAILLLGLYGILLQCYSSLFLLFNIILISDIFLYHLHILGYNIWNTLLDPILIIILAFFYSYQCIKFIGIRIRSKQNKRQPTQES